MLAATTDLALEADWHCLSLAPDQALVPSHLAALDLPWLAAQVPGTVASALRAAGRFDWGGQDLDQQDHWYQSQVQLPEGASIALVFEGLATLAEVFWNDELMLTSDNMFLSHVVELSGRPRSGTLSIRFKALAKALAQRRPRPRWRTRLVEQQQLRWLRTSLMGRIPGWAPTGAPVGPFRAVRLRSTAGPSVLTRKLAATLQQDTGQVDVALTLQTLAAPDLAVLCVGDERTALDIAPIAAGRWALQGTLQVHSPQRWWPHTHGCPALYPVALELGAGATTMRLELGQVGFRDLQVEQAQGAFQVQLNGVPVFCRGACWTPPDVLTLNADEATLRATLNLVRDAGMNMLRVGGTMVYESDVFYRLCDELGILVWQDFMFANMDYPVDDPAFAQNIAAEASQFLQRVQGAPSLAVLCGGSEIEQQAAMLGLPPAHWRNAFFGSVLPGICAEYRADVPYVPSSPSGGSLPFQVDQSVSHYYGVGAYLRPLDDARRAGVRFTSECLGFANVPEETTIDSMLGNGQQPFHHPVWKQRVPRDSGAGWDFDDVRDHYLAQLFGVDPMRLRYADMARYLALSRVTSAEVMERTLSEWRRSDSSCKGALVWFLRDLWPGAGWGVIDALGVPKAAWYGLKRAMAPQAMAVADEGLNGLVLHAHNDGPDELKAELSLTLLRHGEVPVAQASQPVRIAAHGSVQLRADAMFAHFLDTSYAYRFGAPGHHAAVACLTRSGDNTLLSQAFHFPLGVASEQVLDIGLQAQFAQTVLGGWEVVLNTRQLARFVQLDVPGCLPADNYFHLAPSVERRIALKGVFKAGAAKGTVGAINLVGSVKISPPA